MKIAAKRGAPINDGSTATITMTKRYRNGSHIAYRTPKTLTGIGAY